MSPYVIIAEHELLDSPDEPLVEVQVGVARWRESVAEPRHGEPNESVVQRRREARAMT